jgi:hypothetical protein
MQEYIVLFFEQGADITETPLLFNCMADDVDHAEEQAENSYPNCDIVWVYQGASTAAALDDYYGVEE